MADFLSTLKAARMSELAVRASVEHLERLHRIAALPGRSAEYAGRICEKLAVLERRLNEDIDRLADVKTEALNVLDRLSGDERTVLYQYYILGKEWRKIADEMYMCDRNVYKIRRRAIEKLTEIYYSDNPRKKASGE